MSFTKFTALKQRSVDQISITSSNTFNFPRKFYVDNGLDKYNHVVIYYDKDNEQIGFNFTNDENEKYKFKIQKSKGGYGGFISATSFFKSNNLDVHEHKGRYNWEIQEIEGVGSLYVIDLKKA